MRIKHQSALFAVCAIGFGSHTMANLTFDGTLWTPPPCTISNGNTIVIDFKEIGVNSINGVKHTKAVNYTINCHPGTLPWEMVLTVTGVATTFDSSAVQTSNADLGIRLLRDGVPLPLNTKVSINPASPPLLRAVPVKKANASLPAVGFTATATLLAQFQ